jgi:aminoacrylate peracid reductase
LSKQWIDLPPEYATLPVKVPFCFGVRSDDVVYLTGQVGEKIHTGATTATGDMAQQTETAMQSTRGLLEQLGATLDDVVRFNAYYVGADGWRESTQVQAGFFGEGTAHSSTIVRNLMEPPLDVEIDVVAVVGKDKQLAAATGAYRGLDGTPFVPGVRSGNAIFVAAHVATDADGTVLHSGDAAAQTRVVMERIGEVLRELGGDLSDIVKTNVCAPTREDLLASLAVRAELFDDGPASTDVVVPSMLGEGLCVQIEATAFVDTPRTTFDLPGGSPWPIETPFHDGVRVGNAVFVSGQVALAPDGSAEQPGDLAGQTRVVMERIKATLAGLGAEMDDCLRKNTYYLDMDLGIWTEATRVRAEYFTKGPCATGVGVDGFVAPDLLVAMEVVAMVDDEQ